MRCEKKRPRAAARARANIAVQVFLILSLLRHMSLHPAIELTSSLIRIPYFLVSAYSSKRVSTGETYERDPASRRREFVRSAIALICASFLVAAAGGSLACFPPASTAPVLSCSHGVP
ncbi:hypothetical protein [Rhizobium sp. BK418]|uniref:hypothetical protein n=1 Tax=Rhizobium sp. BK418 TaxID=2512120 RepID=UPI001050AB5F|nr:hypothetical protein [Rhizobium sp. BK418]